jgi:hypothetical protein
MSTIRNLNEIPGNTPLHPDDAAQLIPNLATRKELDEWERQNILGAQRWAFNSRVMKVAATLWMKSTCENFSIGDPCIPQWAREIRKDARQCSLREVWKASIHVGASESCEYRAGSGSLFQGAARP